MLIFCSVSVGLGLISTAHPANRALQVKDGRWAYTEIPLIDRDDLELMAADVFGRMRSPWNVNNRPYMTRGLGEMCGERSTNFCELFCEY